MAHCDGDTNSCYESAVAISEALLSDHLADGAWKEEELVLSWICIRTCGVSVSCSESIFDHPHPVVAHDCGDPLSRYTCRATRVATDFLDFIAFCRV